MVDERKIILMTKLALYDKQYGKEDRRRSSYYLEDYIYVKNFRTRISLTIVIMLLAAVHVLQMIEEGIIVPTSLMHFIQVYIEPYLMPWIVAMVIYTMISTRLYASRYAATQKRQKEYNKLLKEFKQYEQNGIEERRAKDGIE